MWLHATIAGPVAGCVEPLEPEPEPPADRWDRDRLRHVVPGLGQRSVLSVGPRRRGAESLSRAHGRPSVEAAARLARRARDRPARQVAVRGQGAPRSGAVAARARCAHARHARGRARRHPRSSADGRRGWSRPTRPCSRSRCRGGRTRSRRSNRRSPTRSARSRRRLRGDRSTPSRCCCPTRPLVTHGALTRALRTLGAVVVAPSADETGTNLLIRRPPAAIDARFGPDSYRRHLQAAAEADVPTAVVDVPELAFDLDLAERYPHRAGVAPRGADAAGLPRPRPRGADRRPGPRGDERPWRRARSRSSTWRASPARC